MAQDDPADLFPARATDPELVEIGRRLFAHQTRFIAGAAEPAALPPETLPEIAFAGRSNVGKSSLVNALDRSPGAGSDLEHPRDGPARSISSISAAR